MVSGFFRLKCHSGGIRGDVTPCENAPQNVKELFRNKLLVRKIESLSREVDELNNPNLPCKRNCRPNLNSVKHNKHETTQTAGSCDGRHVDMDSAQEDSLQTVLLFPMEIQVLKQPSIAKKEEFHYQGKPKNALLDFSMKQVLISVLSIPLVSKQ